MTLRRLHLLAGVQPTSIAAARTTLSAPPASTTRRLTTQAPSTPSPSSSSSSPSSPSPSPVATSLFHNLLQSDRVALAKSITLVESTAAKHKHAANDLLSLVLAHHRRTLAGASSGRIPSNVITPARPSANPGGDGVWKVQELVKRDTLHRKSLEMLPSADHLAEVKQPKNKLPTTLRIGLSGSPGVGKSTFIETFGMWLVDRGFKVAVLAVDPSSTRTGGSILGDKTRMPLLSRSDSAYVRPSPARGTLGGVARNTNDAIVLCEAGGYDIVLVETVGVGQSETMVADMVDLMVLLVSPAGGDELQGMKKGIVEVSDLVLVNKADGELANTARATQMEYMSAMKFLGAPERTRRRRRAKRVEGEECPSMKNGAQVGGEDDGPVPSWSPKVLRVSAAHQLGMDEVWESVLDFYAAQWYADEFTAKREAQRKKWMWRLISEDLQARLAADKTIANLVEDLELRVEHGQITPGVAADRVVDSFLAAHRQ